MPPVYVVQQGARLCIHKRRLQVEKDGEALTSIPLVHVSQVVVFGNASLTTPAIAAFLDRGIDVVFLTASGGYRGRLVGSATPHVPLRRAQYARQGEPEFVLETAKDLVRAKLIHSRALLLRHNRKQADPVIESAAGRIQQSLEAIPRKTALGGLLGLEGAATAAYFSGYRRLFTTEWRFTTRNRRPPRDPVNALLSFGYTLMGRLATGAVETVGLDPYAGFLHEVAYNRPGLGLDVLEEFRPVVDGIVLWCCNSGRITPEDFSAGPAERPVILGEEGVKRFLQAFEQRMEQRFTHPGRGLQLPLRQCMIEQARQIAERILNARPGYTGMGFR